MKTIWLGVFAAALIGFDTFEAGAAGGDLGIGFRVNGQKLFGDARIGTVEFGGAPFNIRYNFQSSGFIETDFAYGELRTPLARRNWDTEMLNIGTKIGLRLLSSKRLNPLLYIGLGVLNFQTGEYDRYWDAYVGAGVGAEFFLTPRLGLNLTGDYRYTSGDDFDGSNRPNGRDMFAKVSFGVNFYLGGNPGTMHTPVYDWGMHQSEADDALVQVDTTQAEPPTEEHTMLTFKKNQLILSITQREMEIKLLQIKISRLGKQVAHLVHQTELEADKGTWQPEADRASEIVYFRNALVLFREAHYGNAVNTLRTLLSSSPSHWLVPRWWYWLGESHYYMSDFDEAAACFARASALKTENAGTDLSDLMVALSYNQAGYESEARAEFERLLLNDPDMELRGVIEDYLGKNTVN